MTRVAIVAVIASCTGTPHEKTPMKPSDCKGAIEGFLSGDPARLRGLPAGCTVADAGGIVDARGGVASSLGEPATGYVFHRITNGTLAARAWLDGDRIVLVDASDPPASADAYLRALGAPEAKLAYTWRDGAIDDAEWLWPSKGVVVDASPQVKGVMRVGIFAPMSLADYQRVLRYTIDRATWSEEVSIEGR